LQSKNRQQPKKGVAASAFRPKIANFPSGTFQAHRLAMKTTTKKIALTCATGILSLAALTTIAGPPVIVVTPPPPPIVVAPPPVAPPAVVVSPAPITPGVAVTVGVPESYTWDGTEYVGVIGDQYYYLGPNHGWLPLGADRLARFHTWERDHHDWRDHATVNEKYRLDAQGHEHPWQHDQQHDHGR
jgi:hypothetical protein